ncbi:flagellar hook protein FlgE [uncultured Alsobacter sp.]|uniref:flagellar hook protein FlgE n=1 Tax=uncultured Alsobacter sp. TaxID=1748258 RepID=UPI0025FCACB5|nr:flagellar hook-basal body complex protein [uncultured Alsobacter sp.]
MSIFSALTTAVIGLQSQSFALEAISGNIANSQTVGFKRVDTAFEDMVTQSVPRTQQAGSVSAFSRGTTTIAGSTTATGVSTNFALDGSGFAAVRQRMDSGGPTPSFSDQMFYTRRGDFQVDRSGYLVNGTGMYLSGYPIDAPSGTPKGSTPDVIKVDVGLSPAKATSTLSYSANLPASARTVAVANGSAGSDVWAAARGTTPASITPITTASSASFADNSISGQSARLYDAKGTPVDLEFRWTKVEARATGGTTWGLYYNATPGHAAQDADWTLATACSFASNGTLIDPIAPVSVNLSSVGLGTVALDLTDGRLTQFADATGEAKVSRLSQDGYASGVLQGVSIGDSGRVVASFSNGQTQELAQIAVARFNAPDKLARGSGGAFAQTPESGDPLFNGQGVSFTSGALEGSNTDVAEEFSKMIVTQQAYSANTRVVSTAQQMMQEVMNIMR